MNLHSLINILLLIYLVSFPVIIEINKRFLKGKNKPFNKAMKMGRKIHPIAGIALVVSGALHGYLKMGGQFVFHTGTLLLLALLFNGFLGFLYRKKRIKRLAMMHRIAGFIIVGLFLLHYINPWLF